MKKKTQEIIDKAPPLVKTNTFKEKNNDNIIKTFQNNLDPLNTSMKEARRRKNSIDSFGEKSIDNILESVHPPVISNKDELTGLPHHSNSLRESGDFTSTTQTNGHAKKSSQCSGFSPLKVSQTEKKQRRRLTQVTAKKEKPLGVLKPKFK